MKSTSASNKDSALLNRKWKLIAAEIVTLLDASSDSDFDDSVMAVFIIFFTFQMHLICTVILKVLNEITNVL